MPAAKNREAVKELEAKLLECESRFKGLFDVTSFWYWEQDGDFRFTRIIRNPDDERRLSVKNSIGKTRWELPVSGVTEEQWKNHKALLMAHKPFYDFEYKRYDVNGAACYSSISGIPVFDTNGCFMGYRGIGRDITELRHAEQLKAMEHAVVQVLSSAENTPEIVQKIIQIICETSGWVHGAFWNMDRQSKTIRNTDTWSSPDIDTREFTAVSQAQLGRLQSTDSLEYGGVIRRVCVTGQPVWVQDVTIDPTFRRGKVAAKAGLHTAMAFPIVVNGAVVGVMEFYSRDIRRQDKALLASALFIGSQIGQNFERKQIEARHTMEHAVARMLTESDALELAIPKILRKVCETLQWDYGGYFEFDREAKTFRCLNLWTVPALEASEFVTQTRTTTFDAKSNAGVARRAWSTGGPVWFAEVKGINNFLRGETAVRTGLHSAFAFPIVVGTEVLGVMEFFSYKVRNPDEKLIESARSIGGQIGHYYHRRLAEEKIQYLAYYDGLTGLPNRALFSQRLNHALATARRYSKKLAVLFIDLDRFKDINDTLGHASGDKLLQDMAGRLTRSLRESDTVARLGGDEFVVLLEEMVDAKLAATVARKVISATVDPFILDDKPFHITASIGISAYPVDGDDEKSLMKNADIAMYLAKDHGRNNYQFYSAQFNALAFERLALESSVRHALANDEFLLHYQAKVDINTGGITGVEALIRWQHPELGMVSPDSFIPLTEETGLIVPIGRWVLKTACAQNKAWQDQGLPPIRVSVNLSSRQFNDRYLLEDIAKILKETGLDPEYLELELTESMVMYNPDHAVKLLTQMKAMGLHVAIDDFGIGYSSLAHLKRFPLDAIKVDRSFIKDLMAHREDAAITEAIIAMGKSLKLKVVAEGVETKDQLSFLRKHDCDEMQGYYFSKPVTQNEFAQILQDGKKMSTKNTPSPE